MIKDFLLDTSRYFRDFLDTDFKRQRLPKRHITRQDRAGNLTSISLGKYPSLSAEIWDKLTTPLGETLHFSIHRGNYQAKINNDINQLIATHVDTIDEEDAESLINNIAQVCRDKITEFQNHSDQLKAEILTALQNEVVRIIVVPLLTRLENHFDVLATHGLETIFDIEEEVCNRLLSNYAEAIGQALNTALTEQDFNQFDSLMADLLSKESIKNKLINNFQSFSANDFFSELHDLNNTLKIKENLELYLYIGDIHYGHTSYPIFYLPLQLSQADNTVTISIDPHLYINKKAIDYVIQETTEEQHKALQTLVKDRIIYLDQSQNFEQCMQQLISQWSDKLDLSPILNLSLKREQKSRSANITITNRLHFSAFDKSDEALLNDYEALLTLAEKDDESFTDFANIVDGFLHDDPKSVAHKVEQAWENLSIEDRLVYRSPIPLNEEQRKILSALREPSSRFITVQGPPGTGKSHTITAIAFEAIMEQKNVLILSDKTEALDVVEEKLTKTLNQVRRDQEFQNPILRLGRSSSTYSRILSSQSIERIKSHHHRAVGNKAELQNQLNRSEQTLKTELRDIISGYQNIDTHQLIDFQQMEQHIRQHFPDFMSFIDNEPMVSAFNAANTISSLLNRDHQAVFELLKSLYPEPSLTDLEHLIKIQSVLSTLHNQYPTTINALKFFSAFDESQVEPLASFIRRYQAVQKPVIGFLFHRQLVHEIDEALQSSLHCQSTLDIHQHLNTLKNAYQVLASLKQQLMQRCHNAKHLSLAFQQLIRGIDINQISAYNASQAIQTIRHYQAQPSVNASQGIATLNSDKLSDWLSLREQYGQQIDTALKYKATYQKLKQHFDALPQFDYIAEKNQLEQLHTQLLANLIDDSVVEFYEQKRTTSQSIREIISKKQRFPQNKFEDLQRAFPCIIANIRDYAEYVPLKPHLFDIIVIDEASQVSIAQAFPAIIRAKKMVVLGDHHQFSNAKTSNASVDLNEQYISQITNRFIKSHETDADVINRLKKFNIKTSVLEFVDMLANHGIMLRKHFRGYPELIQLSSSYFYNDQLQAVKIRTKPIEEIIEFTIVQQKKASARGNVNEAEANFIAEQLEQLSRSNNPPSVGIITPFTDQQRYLTRLLLDNKQASHWLDQLQLKIMTFDSCQGEERDIIFYSMVANSQRNQLYAIFPKSLDEAHKVKHQLRMQRLNVGLSRAKEKIHFVLSQPIEQFSGAIGTVLSHYQQVIEQANQQRDKQAEQLEKETGKHLLQWIKQTEFYQQYAEHIEIIPHFPMEKYLQQLDHNYRHPSYRLDFLLNIKAGYKNYHYMIEYDDFAALLDGADTQKQSPPYYSATDIEREKILESYGYKMLRINRFSLTPNPVSTLSALLNHLTQDAIKNIEVNQQLAEASENTSEPANQTETKRCITCKHIKPLEKFRDPELKSGYGRKCADCKASDTKPKAANQEEAVLELEES